MNDSPPHLHPQSSGFTLIELSTVLVIIGLIIGGILVGRDMIVTAQLRGVITQIERYKTAAMAFKAKYNALPGDMINATDFWPMDGTCGTNNRSRVSTTCNGDGNGRIGYFSSGTWDTNFSETTGFWNQLALAQLIAGGYVMGEGGASAGYGNPVPGASIYGVSIPGSYNSSGIEIMGLAGGGLGAIAGLTNDKNIFVIAIANSTGWPSWQPIGASGNTRSRAFTSAEAYYIDSKMDDGLPYSGTVSGTWDPIWNACGKSLSGINQYTMTNVINHGWPSPSAQGCALFIEAGF